MIEGSRHSGETKAKMSEARMRYYEEHPGATKGDKHPMFGKKHSAETRAKQSAALKGEKNPMFGKRRTEETRRKMSAAQRGEKNPRWRGGRIVDSLGYVRILSSDHPHTNVDGYVLEHRLVMEAHLGRTLLPTEVVHHINGIRDDNRIENLMLFDGQSSHQKWHRERVEE